MGEPTTVLHVDHDSEFIAHAAERLRLEDPSFRLFSETEASAALERLRTGDPAPDCVLGGARTADGDGVALLEAIRAEHDDLPFVLLVDEGSEALAARAIRAGVTDYVRTDEDDAFGYLAERIERAVEEWRAETRIETNRHRFLQLADRLKEVVWMMNPTFDEVLYMNRAFEEVWGVSRNDMGDSLSAHLERVHPDDREVVREAMRRQVEQLQRGETEPVEYSFRIGGPDEGVRWIESTSFPMLDRVGDVDAVGGVARDVTERVERERRLESRVGQLDQASSFISHDLRNILNVAEGNLDIYRDTDDPADLESVGGALERMKEVIADMLQLVELDPSPTELVRRPISGPVRAAWETVDTREARLEIVEDGELEMSESHVRSMVENLVRNAVGHGGADVTVRVGVLPDGFYVEDTGTGIPPDDRERVLEHGFSTGYGGTGTGLTIVKRIADQHGWAIRVAESEEGGARFEFVTDTDIDAGPDATPQGAT